MLETISWAAYCPPKVYLDIFPHRSRQIHKSFFYTCSWILEKQASFWLLSSRPLSQFFLLFLLLVFIIALSFLLHNHRCLHKKFCIVNGPLLSMSMTRGRGRVHIWGHCLLYAWRQGAQMRRLSVPIGWRTTLFLLISIYHLGTKAPPSPNAGCSQPHLFLPGCQVNLLFPHQHLRKTVRLRFLKLCCLTWKFLEIIGASCFCLESWSHLERRGLCLSPGLTAFVLIPVDQAGVL